MDVRFQVGKSNPPNLPSKSLLQVSSLNDRLGPETVNWASIGE